MSPITTIQGAQQGPTNVPVTSSAKSINFKSGIAIMEGQPDQFIEVQVSRVDMSFSGELALRSGEPLWVEI